MKLVQSMKTKLLKTKPGQRKDIITITSVKSQDMPIWAPFSNRLIVYILLLLLLIKCTIKNRIPSEVLFVAPAEGGSIWVLPPGPLASTWPFCPCLTVV